MGWCRNRDRVSLEIDLLVSLENLKVSLEKDGRVGDGGSVGPKNLTGSHGGL